MKIIVITRNEPFFLPIYLSKLFERRHRQIEKVFVDKNSSPHLSSADLLTLCGFKNFLFTSSKYLIFRLLGMTNLKRRGKYFYSINALAKYYSVPVIYSIKVKSPDFYNSINKIKPDILLSVGNSQVIPKKILLIPNLICLNTHGSLLPKYKGILTPFWMLFNRDNNGGVSIHLISEKIDQGKIVGQRAFEITKKDSVMSIYEKIALYGSELIVSALDSIENDNVKHLNIEDEEKDIYYSVPTKEQINKFRNMKNSFC